MVPLPEGVFILCLIGKSIYTLIEDEYSAQRRMDPVPKKSIYTLPDRGT